MLQYGFSSYIFNKIMNKKKNIYLRVDPRQQPKLGLEE